MSKFLRALQKAGLVELQESRTAAPSVAHDVIPDASPADPLPEAPAAAAEPLHQLIEQKPFAQIYAEFQVPESAFPAEKLLKIFDGLAALDPVSRKMAVLALDSADDSWSVDDALLDAERKVRALAQARSQIEEHARSALDSARRDVEQRELRQHEASTTIRAQIADLEALLERELTRASEEKSALHAQARATKEACMREMTRLDQEGSRLKGIAPIFGNVAPQTAPMR